MAITFQEVQHTSEVIKEAKKSLFKWFNRKAIP